MLAFVCFVLGFLIGAMVTVGIAESLGVLDIRKLMDKSE